MFTEQGLRGFVDTLNVNTRNMTDQAASAALARTAEAAKARVLSGMPKPSGYRQIVDGAAGAPLSSVRPDGTIIFAWQYLAEVARRVYELLFQSSPIVTGEYARGIQVLADGERVSETQVPGAAKQVHVVPTVPYARRLEVGRRKDGTPFSIEVPLHNVEQTATVARRLYGDLAAISFVYVELVDAYALHHPRRHRRGARDEMVHYPAILIEPRSF